MAERGKHMFPSSILTMLKKIKGIANTKIICGENEIEIHASDPGEDGEEESIRQLGILQQQLEKCGFKAEPFFRGEKGIDAIRIYVGNNVGEYMKNENEKDFIKIGGQADFMCQTCGNKIENASCSVHEEVYEVGHKYDCPYKQVIKKECLIV